MNKKETYQNILHLIFSGYIDLLPKELQHKTLLHGSSHWFVYIFRYVFVYTKSWLFAFVKKKSAFQNRKKIFNKIWIFADTSNQYEALSFLKKELRNTVWVSRKFSTETESFIHLLSFLRLVYLIQFPAILKALDPQNNKLKGKIFEASGQYSFFQDLLRKNRPRMVILSNDHSIASRSLLLAAKSLSIPTVYIQHASVSPYFPNLEATLNLLEGKHALDIYKECGQINGEVVLIGMPKFEKYRKFQNNKSKIVNIGVAFNPSDKKEKIEEFMNDIPFLFPSLLFTYRKHPREERVFSFKGLPNMKESFPQQENVFQFLSQQDMLFAGDSSIHLEATLLNIISVYYDFTAIKEKEDYYGFVKNKMIFKAENNIEVKKLIIQFQKNKPNVINKAAYYNDLINSKSNKSSTDLAIENLLPLLD